jgi:RNA polymerase sigma-70 factor, ECF subfamily
MQDPAPQGAMKDPQTRLMLRFQQGDDEAFSQLVDEYEEYLQRWFRREFHDWHVAEDLSQKVFLKVFLARENYVPSAKFKTWLCQIAMNVVRNERRTRGRRAVALMSPDTMAPLYSEGGDQEPAVVVERKELQEIVRDAIGTLTQRSRQAVVLRFQDRLSYAAIGRVIHSSSKAAKSLLTRTKDRLRPRLRSYLQRECA